MLKKKNYKLKKKKYKLLNGFSNKKIKNRFNRRNKFIKKSNYKFNRSKYIKSVNDLNYKYKLRKYFRKIKYNKYKHNIIKNDNLDRKKIYFNNFSFLNKKHFNGDNNPKIINYLLKLNTFYNNLNNNILINKYVYKFNKLKLYNIHANKTRLNINRIINKNKSYLLLYSYLNNLLISKKINNINVFYNIYRNVKIAKFNKYLINDNINNKYFSLLLIDTIIINIFKKFNILNRRKLKIKRSLKYKSYIKKMLNEKNIYKHNKRYYYKNKRRYKIKYINKLLNYKKFNKKYFRIRKYLSYKKVKYILKNKKINFNRFIKIPKNLYFVNLLKLTNKFNIIKNKYKKYNNIYNSLNIIRNKIIKSFCIKKLNNITYFIKNINIYSKINKKIQYKWNNEIILLNKNIIYNKQNSNIKKNNEYMWLLSNMTHLLNNNKINIKKNKFIHKIKKLILRLYKKIIKKLNKKEFIHNKHEIYNKILTKYNKFLYLINDLWHIYIVRNRNNNLNKYISYIKYKYHYTYLKKLIIIDIINFFKGMNYSIKNNLYFRLLKKLKKFKKLKIHNRKKKNKKLIYKLRGLFFVKRKTIYEYYNIHSILLYLYLFININMTKIYDIKKTMLYNNLYVYNMLNIYNTNKIILNISLNERNSNVRYYIYDNSRILHSRSIGSLGFIKDEKKMKKWKKKLGEHLTYWTYKLIKINDYKYDYIYFYTKAKRRMIKLLYYKLKYFLRKRKKNIKKFIRTKKKNFKNIWWLMFKKKKIRYTKKTNLYKKIKQIIM